MCVVAFIFILLPSGEGGRRPDEGRSEARTGRVRNSKAITLNWFSSIFVLKILSLCRLLRKPSSALRAPSPNGGRVRARSYAIAFRLVGRAGVWGPTTK